MGSFDLAAATPPLRMTIPNLTKKTANLTKTPRPTSQKNTPPSTLTNYAQSDKKIRQADNKTPPTLKKMFQDDKKNTGGSILGFFGER